MIAQTVFFVFLIDVDVALLLIPDPSLCQQQHIFFQRTEET